MVKLLLLILLLSICPRLAIADARTTATSVWIGATVLEFDYEEYDGQDESLDREDGLLPGINAGASIEGDRWFVESGLLWSYGRVDYHSSAVEDTPAIDSETDEQIFNLEVIAGTPLFASDRHRASLVAGTGYRNWQRDIYSTPMANGLDETYQWYYWLLGLRGEHEFSGRTRIIADVQLTRTANPEVDVQFKANYDDVNLDLGKETGFKASFSLLRKMSGSASLWLTPWYERWELGRSRDEDLYQNGVPVGTVWEPRSETHNYGVNFGVRWEFGGS